jgi:hypothetical protein
MAVAYTGVKEHAARSPMHEGQLMNGLFRCIFGNRQVRCNRLTSRRLPGNRRRQLPPRANRFHRFLTRLRAGGRSNMYGAIPYLMEAFALDRETAFRIVCEWVDLQREEATRLGAEPSTRG